MESKQYKKLQKYIEKHRYRLLLAATLLVLILPSFSGQGILGDLLFVISISFLFIQSMVATTPYRKKWRWTRYLVLGIMVLVVWLDPVGLESYNLDIIQFILFVAFFVFVNINLGRFIVRSPQVNENVILSSINVYLILGIIAGSLAYLFYNIFTHAYNLPAYIAEPTFVNFLYYSFVTMSTLGYGDITPAIPETQTLAYLVAIFGQLYVAIIIALLVGKYLVHSAKPTENK